MKTTKNAVGSAKTKKRSRMMDISGDGELRIDPLDGEIIFLRSGAADRYRYAEFIALERLSFGFDLGFDHTQFIESGPDEDDPYWFRVDEASEVLMKILAKLSAREREAIFKDCK